MVGNGQVRGTEGKPGQVTHLSKAFWIVSGLFAVWYLGGLVLMSPWVPREWRQMVSGWGDCIFLTLAALLTWMNARRDAPGGRILVSVMGVLLISGAVETLGVRTGFPFGRYAYTHQLGGKILGVLPWIIPVCWLILVFNAHIIVSVLFSREKMGKILPNLITALVVTLVDLNLEPVAVHTKQYWIWAEKDSAYYGVPGLNFLGWFVVSAVLSGGLSWRLDARGWRVSTAWISWVLLGSIQFFFALMNVQSDRNLPAGIALGLAVWMSFALARIRKMG